MSNVATATLTIQYTPPNAGVNSGSTSYTVQSTYSGQNVGQLDIQPGITPPAVNAIPFGTITQLLMLVIKNLQSTDIGVRINGGLPLAQAGTTASVTSTAGSLVTITGLSGMTPSMVGGTLTLSGATSSVNNGSFTITGYVSTTSVVISNASAVAGDANNTHIVWSASNVIDNFRIPPQGEIMYAAPSSPMSEPITSVSVVSTANPLVVENISFFVFGN